MRLDAVFYQLSYRFASPRWDTGTPRPELVELVAGRRPGRALDLGCGTGTNAVYLARQGWEVVGVDFSPLAIETARKRGLASGSSTSFVTGDVTDLARAGVRGPFDLVVDIGCYHTLTANSLSGLRVTSRSCRPPGGRLLPGGDSRSAGDLASAAGHWRRLGRTARPLQRRLRACERTAPRSFGPEIALRALPDGSQADGRARRDWPSLGCFAFAFAGFFESEVRIPDNIAPPEVTSRAAAEHSDLHPQARRPPAITQWTGVPHFPLCSDRSAVVRPDVRVREECGVHAEPRLALVIGRGSRWHCRRAGATRL